MDFNVQNLVVAYRIKKAQCPQLEQATFTWFKLMEDHNVALFDDLVVVAAKRLCGMTPKGEGEKQLQFSHGWVDRFMKRFRYTRHGGDAFVDTSHEILRRLSRKKKERIIVALTANIDGAIKLHPLVINKYLNPQASSHMHILNLHNLGIKWFANKKAWMAKSAFKKFKLDFERRMVVAQKAKVSLLVDSFSSHQIRNAGAQLKVARVEYMPPDTASRFNARIIQSFKAQYYKRLI